MPEASRSTLNFLEGWTKMRAMMKIGLWLLVSAVLFDVSAALTSDGLALLDFKNGVTGNHSAVQNWNASDTSPCKWTNIVCNKQGYVSMINLENQTLSGKLSASLGKLQSLQELHLSNNRLHGSIPRELGNCTALTLLHLFDNLFTGTIPLELGNLTKLTEIDLGMNSLNGQVPQKIFENVNLVNIYLNDNNLTGDVTPGLEALSKLPAIAEIWMQNNYFTGSLPPSLGNAINLDSFLIYHQNLGNGSGIGGTIPKELGKLVNLTSLDLRDNNFTGSIPAELGNLTNLQELLLSSNQLTGIIPKELGKLNSLVYLNLYQNKLTGGIPSELGNLSNLTDFVIYVNNLTGPIPKSFGQLYNLQRFDVHNNSLSGHVPTEIYNCTLLQIFYLSDNQFSGGIAPEIGKLTQLQTLRMGTNNFSGPLPAEIVNCKSLTEMVFYTNRLTGSIPTGVANITTLQQIFFYDNLMSGPLPPQLGMFSNITYLDIRNNSFNGTLPEGLCNFGGLTFLDVLGNKFEGAIPVSLSSCVSLTRFRAALNRFTSLPDGFGKGGALDWVDLSSNQLRGVLPKNLGANSNLSNLNLGDNHLSGDLSLLPFAQLANLQQLNLSTNKFTGQIPSAISSCTKLFTLDLSSNSLNGTVSSALGNLTRLETLYLDDNNFTGIVTSIFMQFNNMLFLDLAHNPFGGSIPSEIGTLSTLENLNLSYGQFSGAIPSELNKLDQLVVLDLSHNNLSGVVPSSLGDMQSLSSVNVSYNNLSGSLPSGWVQFLNTTPSDFSGNPDLCKQYSSQNLCVNTTSITPAASGGKKLKWWVWMAIALCSIGFLLAVGTVLGLWWFYPRNRRKLTSQSSIEVMSSPGITISFDEIMEATENLSDKCIIGKGGYGTVYKGILMSGTPIVVKKIVGLDTNNRVYKSFLTEIETIGSAKHRNLVKLLGFCKWGDTGLLLYDYVSNGDLHDALHNKEAGVVMDWPTRLRIAEGVAHGLNYLHHDYIPSIIHRDIKASNVLLDNDLEAHISDFGIAKVMDMKKDKPATSSAVVTGTYGYIAPEAGFGTMLSPKVDVYSYGILLLELLTGKLPVDPSFGDHMHIAAWVRGMVKEKSAKLGEAVLDPVLLLGTNDLQKSQMIRVLRTAVLCTKENPNDRPSMTAVVDMLRTSGFPQPQASQQPKVTPR